jgi:hypothetical protein
MKLVAETIAALGAPVFIRTICGRANIKVGGVSVMPACEHTKVVIRGSS